MLDQFAGLDDLFGVEAGGGLVEHQHVGVVNDGLRQAHALAVALGELADQLVAHVAERATFGHFVHAALDIGARRCP